MCSRRLDGELKGAGGAARRSCRPAAEPRRGVNFPNLPNFRGMRNGRKFRCDLLLEAWSDD
jgi:hypothetical protein